jgi:hypothetical protein
MQKDPDPKPCGATAPYSYNQRKRARLGKIAVQRSVVRFAAEYSSILSPRDVVFTLAPAENPGKRHPTVGASSSMSHSSGIWIIFAMPQSSKRPNLARIRYECKISMFFLDSCGKKPDLSLKLSQNSERRFRRLQRKRPQWPTVHLLSPTRTPVWHCWVRILSPSPESSIQA